MPLITSRIFLDLLFVKPKRGRASGQALGSWSDACVCCRARHVTRRRLGLHAHLLPHSGAPSGATPLHGPCCDTAAEWESSKKPGQHSDHAVHLPDFVVQRSERQLAADFCSMSSQHFSLSTRIFLIIKVGKTHMVNPKK